MRRRSCHALEHDDNSCCANEFGLRMHRDGSSQQSSLDQKTQAIHMPKNVITIIDSPTTPSLVYRAHRSTLFHQFSCSCSTLQSGEKSPHSKACGAYAPLLECGDASPRSPDRNKSVPKRRTPRFGDASPLSIDTAKRRKIAALQGLRRSCAGPSMSVQGGAEAQHSKEIRGRQSGWPAATSADPTRSCRLLSGSLPSVPAASSAGREN